jgi:uncharacterized protein
MNSSQTVAILGASDQPDRYAYRADEMLREHGHRVILVHPTLKEIGGRPVVASLREISMPVDTLTIYVGAARLPALAKDIIELHPRRVIFNPGTESAEVQEQLTRAGISWIEACTLVLLRSAQF